MSTKQELIIDIQNLLNSYDNVNSTSINPDLLEFLDEKTLLNIVESLLNQKEEAKKSDLEWLEKFKKNNQGEIG